MAKQSNPWKRLSSKLVHENPFYFVRQDEVIKPDGSPGQYNVVVRPGSAFALAVDSNNKVYLIGLHRYTIDQYSIEVPSGGLDGQDPLVAAKRELKEETGLEAKHWKKLGIVHPANGVMSEDDHIFLATDLSQTDVHEQAEEGIDQVIIVSLYEALKMAQEGRITDAQSIAALTLAALKTGLL